MSSLAPLAGSALPSSLASQLSQLSAYPSTTLRAVPTLASGAAASAVTASIYADVNSMISQISQLVPSGTAGNGVMPSAYPDVDAIVSQVFQATNDGATVTQAGASAYPDADSMVSQLIVEGTTTPSPPSSILRDSSRRSRTHTQPAATGAAIAPSTGAQRPNRPSMDYTNSRRGPAGDISADDMSAFLGGLADQLPGLDLDQASSASDNRLERRQTTEITLSEIVTFLTKAMKSISSSGTGSTQRLARRQATAAAATPRATNTASTARVTTPAAAAPSPAASPSAPSTTRDNSGRITGRDIFTFLTGIANRLLGVTGGSSGGGSTKRLARRQDADATGPVDPADTANIAVRQTSGSDFLAGLADWFLDNNRSNSTHPLPTRPRPRPTRSTAPGRLGRRQANTGTTATSGDSNRSGRITAKDIWDFLTGIANRFIGGNRSSSSSTTPSARLRRRQLGAATTGVTGGSAQSSDASAAQAAVQAAARLQAALNEATAGAAQAVAAQKQMAEQAQAIDSAERAKLNKSTKALVGRGIPGFAAQASNPAAIASTAMRRPSPTPMPAQPATRFVTSRTSRPAATAQANY